MDEPSEPQGRSDQHSAKESSAGYSELVRRTAVTTTVAIGCVAGALLLWRVLDVLLLIFAGTLVAVFFHGCSVQLSRWTHLPRRGALGLVVLVLLLAVAGGAVYTVPQVVEQINVLVDELTEAAEQLFERIQKHKWVHRVVEETPVLGELIRRTPDPVAFINHASSTTFGILVGTLVILFVGLYGAFEPETYRRGLLLMVPPARRSGVSSLISEMGATLWWWLIGRIVSMAIIGIVTAVGLWWLGIPLPFLLAVFAALLTFIPNIGPVIAVTPPTLLALEQSGLTALAVVAFYTGLQAVESYIITPLVQRKAIALPPVLLLTAQLVLTALGGFIGLAVATPLMAVTVLLVRRLHVDRFEQPEA